MSGNNAGLKMDLYLNKRLLLPFLVLLGAFNIIPIGIFSVKNIDPMKMLTVMIFGFAAISVKKLFAQDVRYVTFFIIAIFLSVFNMFSKGKYMDWTFFYCLNYFNFFALLVSFRKVQDIRDYISILLLLSFLASILHFVFYMFPSLLTGKLNEIRMGSLNFDTSKVRIFIPGMGFIAICFTYLVTKLLYFRKLSPVEYGLLVLFFSSVFIFSSVRTNLLGVFVAVLTLLVLGKLSLRNIAYFGAFSFLFLMVLALFSADLYQFIAGRFDIFLKLGDFQFLDAIRLDVDYDNETTWGTIYFRIMEVVYVLNNFSGDMRSILFGNIGTLYDFLGVEQEPAPHVGIVGIYYLFGLVGLTLFVTLFVHFSKIIFRNIKMYKSSGLEFLTIVIAIIWFSLFAISFFGGVYYSELILLVTFCMAASLLLKKNLVYGGS